jgi:FG-GAP-like repeat
MKSRSSKILAILIFILSLCSTASPQIDSTKFKHHYIANPLPGPPEYGTGGFALADFDRDGNLDITISRRADSAKCYWYQYKMGVWSKHLVGIADNAQLGAASVDINVDGFPDLVMGRIWFENPGYLAKFPDSPWIKHVYNGGLQQENHDIAVFDLNNDKKPDVICYAQNHNGGTLRWYDVSDPIEWKYYDVAINISQTIKDNRLSSNGIHGGFAPSGIGDLDNDGYADIMMPLGWYKNPGKNATQHWILVPWSFQIGIIPNPYGLSTRSWIYDLDSDGDNDIVFTDCDVEGSNGYWVENIMNGKNFILHPLPTPGKPTGSFHSLAIADFDLDGDPDIFSGEQEDPNPGMKPKGLKERGFFWENIGDGKKPKFKVNILHIDNPGWHDVRFGDVDGDGDIDIVSKIWNKDGENYHADFWENLYIVKAKK